MTQTSHLEGLVHGHHENFRTSPKLQSKQHSQQQHPNKPMCNASYNRRNNNSSYEFKQPMYSNGLIHLSRHLLNNQRNIIIATKSIRTRGRQRRESMLVNQISLVVILLICYFTTHQNSLLPANIIGANAQQLPDGVDSSSSSSAQEYHQHNNILRFSVEENRPNNTFVGTIRSADGQVPYLILPSFQTPETEVKQAFNVNLTTGDITTSAVLDREHRDQYHFIAIIKEPFAEIKCTIEVRDVNDNAPKFQTLNPNATKIVIEMPEGMRGYRQVLPLAIDYDSPLNGIREFRIISDNTPSGTFLLADHGAPARSTLNQNGNLGSTKDDSSSSMMANDPLLKSQLDQESTVLIPSYVPMQSATSAMRSFLIDLEASDPLDRENQSSYQLVVEAIDGGQPRLTGQLTVTVNVLDINDNDPVFQSKYYETSINENATRPSFVQRVMAYDADLDFNGQLSYYLKRHVSSSQQQATNSTSSDYNNNGSNNNNGNNEVITSRFSTNSNKGRVQPPPSQQQPTVSQALVKPLGGSQSRNSAGVDFQEMGHKLRSPSSSSPPSAQDQLFEVDPNKGEIYLINQLDYETDQWHELTIEARDHGKPPRSSYTTVKIHVIDTKDDPLPIPRPLDDRNQSGLVSTSPQASTSEKPQQEFRIGQEPVEAFGQSLVQSINLNLTNWFSQINSSILFVIVFVALFAVTFPVCLVKIKSRQPESDYNDTAGLTMASNNGQTKPSPSHSANNIEHPNGMLNDSLHHHHHHDHQSRRPPNLGGSFGGQNMNKLSGYHFPDSSSNHYHNLYPAQQRQRHHSSTSHHLLPESPADHQMPPVSGLQGVGGSRGGTMTLSHNHHHHHLHLLNQSGHHHSLDHHQHQFAGANMTNSLTYAHSHAVLLHQAHHHQSSHQLSPVHLNHQVQLGGSSHLNKGGTLNSIGTHHSAHHPPSSSPMPATPNTIHSSVIQPTNMHDQPAHHGHRNSALLPSIPQSGQLPPTPTHQMNSIGNVFSYPPSHGPGSTLGCYPDGLHMGNDGAHDNTPGSTVDSCSSPAGGGTTPQPLDRWLNLGVPAQLVNTQDWCGSYDWDYLENWTPEYHTLLPLIQADSASVSY
uniref:Protein dachsous n=1 Tax=Aceria tosichella TaxID=561515 RepID=A0A6G1SNR1_9ACAR